MIITEKNDLIKSKVTLDQFHDAFNWKVTKDPLFINGSAEQWGQAQEVPGFFATVRENEDGSRAPLGVVKGRYEVIGNQRILDTVEELLGVGSGEPYDYQVKNNGARFAFRLLFPKYLTPNVNDKSNFLQLCLSVVGSHDGSSGLTVEISPILRYCLNGLLSLGGAHALQSVRHTANADHRLGGLRGLFGSVENEFEQFGVLLGKLSETKVTRDGITEYVKRVLDVTEPDNEKISARTLNVIGEIETLARRGRGNDGETLWSAFNGVTEYVDHYRGTDKARGFDSVAGGGADLKRRALEEALVLIGK